MRDEIGTRHGDLRLMQRAREIDVPMTEVWEEAVPCEVKYHGYDEARVSAKYGIVLLREDGKIVTCLNATHNVTVEGEDFESFLDDVVESEPKDLSGNSHNSQLRRSDENNARHDSEDRD
jgi:hypothetical protein